MCLYTAFYRSNHIRSFSFTANFLSDKSVLICGDFNINYLDKNDFYTKKCVKLLDMFDLRQHVNVTTHQLGNLLDWIITRSDDFMPQEAPTADHLLSDHFSVTCYFSVPLTVTGTKDILFRGTKNIDIDAFKSDLSLLDVIRNPPENLDILVDDYNEELCILLDKHAPIVKKSVRLQTQHPWYDQELKDLKSKMRQSERSKNKICGPNPANRDKFKLLRNQ